MISIRRVDGTSVRIGRLLQKMHDELFGDDAPQINPLEGFWWMAWEGKTPVGFAGLKASEYRADTGYLYRAAVKPKARGRGIQRGFITVRERFGRRQGWKELVSDTTDNQPSAHNLKLAGYSLYTPEIKYGFENTKYWRKSL